MKEEAKLIIAKAAEASSNVQEACNKAGSALACRPGLNAHGVYLRRDDIRSTLIDAYFHIGDALKQLDATKWPTHSDYDRAEGEG
jgi:hypothetical protein